MRLTFLGNCANQTSDHEGVALLVDAGATSTLIDAGPGVVRQIYRAGRHCSDIDTIFVTHSHGDHVLGFPYVLFSMFYEGLAGTPRTRPVRVVTTERLQAGLDSMLRFCYDPSRWPFAIDYTIVNELAPSTLLLEGMEVSTGPVDHTTPTFGLRLVHEGRVLSYSSDTLECDEVVRLASNSDLLVHEGFCTEKLGDLARRVKHATAAMAGRVATRAKAKRLALVHVFPPVLGHESDLVAEAKLETAVEVFVPAELLTVTV